MSKQEKRTKHEDKRIVVGSEFWVECNVCKQRLKNWTGSTPCCGSIAWIIENDKPSDNISLFISIDGKTSSPTKVKLK